MDEPTGKYAFKPEPSHTITMTGREYDKKLAQAREQEREKCCKEVCYYCRLNRPVKKNWKGEYCHIDVNGLPTVRCIADPIYTRASADAAKEQ